MKEKMHKLLYLLVVLFVCVDARRVRRSTTTKPCPLKCTCQYDTMTCNEMMDSCAECIHWSHIEFSQITQLDHEASFRHFQFAPNRTTHITIYKLLNSTIGPRAFDNLHIPRHALVQIKFQYNSLIQFDKSALHGANLDSNATLAFLFPYITQVVFVAKCFDGVRMRDDHSRLIIRISKSFSVKFVGSHSRHHHSLKKSIIETTPQEDDWSMSRGQFIIDIKSTHSVKFEESSLAHLTLASASKFYIDLELVEKLMIQRDAFAHMTVESDAALVFYAKQITFIDFKAFSFANVSMQSGGARVQVYLEELTSSLCVQRNVFSDLKFLQTSNKHKAALSYFNFSVINSKNVMLMHHAFSNAHIQNDGGRLVIGVYNMPSALLLLRNNYFYQTFLIDRLEYIKDDLFDLNEYYHRPPSPEISSRGILNLNDKFDLSTFYLHNKQTYSYNVSIERDCFSNLSTANNNVWIVADNVHTLLVDNEIVDQAALANNNNVNFQLNVKNLVLSPSSLQGFQSVRIEFMRDPKTFKFGTSNKQRITLVGLNLQQLSSSEMNSSTEVVDYYSDLNEEILTNMEQENIDLRRTTTSTTFIDILCGSGGRDSIIKIEPLHRTKEGECTCPIISLMLNQLAQYGNNVAQINRANILPCHLNDFELVQTCRRQLDLKCSQQTNEEDYFLKDYVKFWKYCISEVDPFVYGGLSNNDDNPFNYDDEMMNNRSDLASSTSSSSSFPAANNNNMGKIIGIVIICFVCGIILFMVAVNIIQYKFRNDFLDDLECSSTNRGGGDNHTTNNSNYLSNQYKKKRSSDRGYEDGDDKGEDEEGAHEDDDDEDNRCCNAIVVDYYGDEYDEEDERQRRNNASKDSSSSSKNTTITIDKKNNKNRNNNIDDINKISKYDQNDEYGEEEEDDEYYRSRCRRYYYDENEKSSDYNNEEEERLSMTTPPPPYDDDNVKIKRCKNDNKTTYNNNRPLIACNNKVAATKERRAIVNDDDTGYHSVNCGE